MKRSTRTIISYIEKGLTQTEIFNKGYPLSTVRYHFRKMKRPKAHEKTLKRHNSLRNKNYALKKKNSLKSKEVIHK